jgi:hypothetical protein
MNSAARVAALFTQFGRTGHIGRWQRANDYVDVRQPGEYVHPYDFAEPSFHPIAVDRGMRIARYDDPRPGITQKGSDVPNLEVRGSDSLPLQADSLERAFPRQPKGARKAAVVRCPRTSTAA